MAAVVCRGLHSSFVDSPQMVALPQLSPPQVTLRLKLAPPKPADLGGWSFLQFSLNSTNSSPQESATTVKGKDGFIPPPARQPPPVKLSERSLQLCTENLGSETGTDIGEMEGNFAFAHVGNSEFSRKTPTELTRQPSGGKKVNPPREIPPPLTTMRGAETLQVRARREEGRLVVNAVKSPPTSSCFLAERGGGRLRLSLLRDDQPDTDIYHSCDREETDELQESESDGIDRRMHNEFSHGTVENGRENRTGGDERSSVNMEPLLFGEGDVRDHDDGEIITETVIHRSIIMARCREGEHDHHQNNMLNWEPLC